jgi:hypothetical protein
MQHQSAAAVAPLTDRPRPLTTSSTGQKTFSDLAATSYVRRRCPRTESGRVLAGASFGDDRGRVLADLATADGGTTIGEIGTLGHQGELFGPVASDTTAWRTLSQCDGVVLARISKARAKIRSHVSVAKQVRVRPGQPGCLVLTSAGS